VFSLNFGWTGFYEYLGAREVATITVNGFNATTSRVNVTLLDQSRVQLKLAGKSQHTC
jgi:CUB/sushi domain-containing protein